MFKLSPKYIKLAKSNNKEDHLEGTTQSGKTTMGVPIFIMKCLTMSKKQHVIAGLDQGTLEKNIINAELGIAEIFDGAVEYYAKGKGNIRLPHLKIDDHIFYVMGYDNINRWKKALGGQYGGAYIDEINIADIDFVREIKIRCDYLMDTSNPDNPDLEIYSEVINKSRPIKEYEKDYPDELLENLSEERNEGAVHWYLTFDDNPGMTEDKRNQLLNSAPKGTKLYKNKILGLRGRATGLIFNIEERHLVTAIVNDQGNKRIERMQFQKFSCGVDTSYSQKTNDTIAFVYGGLTSKGEWVILDIKEYNNKNLNKAITPSDVPVLLDNFIEKNTKEWGYTRSVFIDSADQATILECRKWKRENGKSYQINGAYKKTTIIDRINLQNGWLATGKFYIVSTCTEYTKECNLYSWDEKKDIPEDKNDHTINAAQYGWLPYKASIGKAGA